MFLGQVVIGGRGFDARRLPRHRRDASVRAIGRVLRALLARLSLLTLVGFHVALLSSHILNGRVLDPGVALRWLAAALITAGFLTLRRKGASLVWGRYGVILWLLVAMLHVQAAAQAPARLDAAQLPEAAAALAGLAAGTAGTVLGACLLSLLVRGGLRRPRLRRSRATSPSFISRLASGHLLQVTCRPPPALQLS